MVLGKPLRGPIEEAAVEMKMVEKGVWWSEPSLDISSDLAPCGCVSALMIGRCNRT